MKLKTILQSKANWEKTAYQEKTKANGMRFDEHEQVRFRALKRVNKQLRESDEDFVRYAFEQEVIARENISSLGVRDSLRLGAYMLATFQRKEDIPLFWRAKSANWDTQGGFHIFYVFCALGEDTVTYLSEHHPEVKAGLSRLFGATLGYDKSYQEEWWQWQVEEYSAM